MPVLRAGGIVPAVEQAEAAHTAVAVARIAAAAVVAVRTAAAAVAVVHTAAAVPVALQAALQQIRSLGKTRLRHLTALRNSYKILPLRFPPEYSPITNYFCFNLTSRLSSSHNSSDSHVYDSLRATCHI